MRQLGNSADSSLRRCVRLVLPEPDVIRGLRAPTSAHDEPIRATEHNAQSSKSPVKRLVRTREPPSLPIRSFERTTVSEPLDIRHGVTKFARPIRLWRLPRIVRRRPWTRGGPATPSGRLSPMTVFGWQFAGRPRSRPNRRHPKCYPSAPTRAGHMLLQEAPHVVSTAINRAMGLHRRSAPQLVAAAS
jgi:hypothetical protein